MSFYNRLIPIDFEYNRSKDEKMNIVSVAYIADGERYNVWLHHNDSNREKFCTHMRELRERGKILLCHNAVAEGRSFISLGLNPTDFLWIDNFAEHRMITNHNDRMMFGDQLIKGRVIRTHRKEYGEQPSVYTAKPEHSLAATTYKMLGKSIDLDNKDDTRDIIIHGTYEEIERNKQRILDYGASDIDNLILIHKAHIKEYKRLLGKDFVAKDFIKGQLLRGENMVRTAMMETVGYPINFQAVKNFALHTDDILGEIAADCNEQFPDISPFVWDDSLNRYKVDTKAIQGWIERSKWKDGWELTKRGYSLAREHWEERFGNGHVFERGNFGSQMYRYFYTKQHMNGFQSTKGKKDTFWDNVGRDGRVRPWLNPYRAQSSRFQPAATGFIPLKAAWMRSLIQPKKGKAICAIDYSSQEFLISGLWSGDMKMIEAYKSGDVYMAFAKEAGMVPPDATKHTHPNERQIAKAIVLGISYGLTKVGLAVDLGCSEDEAQEYIDTFYRIYHVYYNKIISVIGRRGYNEAGQWIEERGDYQVGSRRVELPCGFIMFGDNDNMRSVGNCNIQGFGASIIRKAIQLCQDAGLRVMYPLHDALYIEFDKQDWAEVLPVFNKCMIDAFVHYFPSDMKRYARLIRTDFEVWGFEDEIELVVDGQVIKTEYIHVDERHVEEYKQFSKYFDNDKDLEDL